MADTFKQIIVGVIVGIVVLAAGYYFFDDSKNVGEDDFTIQQADGKQYVVNDDGEKISDGFDSIENLGNGTVIGTTGGKEFLIIIKEDKAQVASPGFDDIKVTENGLVGVVEGNEIGISETGEITSDVPENVQLETYEDVVKEDAMMEGGDNMNSEEGSETATSTDDGSVMQEENSEGTETNNTGETQENTVSDQTSEQTAE